jgi:hypothetical protein
MTKTKLAISSLEAKVLVILHLIPDDVDVGKPESTTVLKTSLRTILEHAHCESEVTLGTLTCLLGSLVRNHEAFFRLRRDLYEMIYAVMLTDMPAINSNHPLSDQRHPLYRRHPPCTGAFFLYTYILFSV